MGASQGWTAVAEPTGWTPVSDTPTFKTTNAKDASGNAEVDPNTIGTALRHFGAQINPVTILQGAASVLPVPQAAGGAGVDAPLRFVQKSVFPTEILLKAKDALQQGDYVTAARHFIDYILPVIGPALEHPADELQQGKYAAGIGDALGLGAALFGAEGLSNMLKGVRTPAIAKPNPAIDFATQRRVPVDAATASDNLAVKGTQALVDRSIGGSMVATPARAAQAAAMTRVGDELATDVHPQVVMPEQAGQTLRDALTTKIAGHARTANAAYDTLRRLEEQTPSPVNLTGSKQAIRPVYDQMKRQMPLTQQQANPGLKALDNILSGPDAAPLSQVDRDLSAIKAVAREQGGLAKFAVTKLEAAVTEAAKRGGVDMWKALQEGRAATLAKYQTADVLDQVHAEPVKAISALTAPKDAAIQRLRTVTQQIPQQTPIIARAYLEDLLAKPNKVAEWNKLGAQTKAVLFPKAGQAAALDHFFALTKRISDTNVNPSGSGYMASLGAQGAMLWYDPLHAIPMQISAVALAKLLRSPSAVQALTRGLLLPTKTPVAIRAAATAKLVQAAKEASVELGVPQAADQGSGQ